MTKTISLPRAALCVPRWHNDTGSVNSSGCLEMRSESCVKSVAWDPNTWQLNNIYRAPMTGQAGGERKFSVTWRSLPWRRRLPAAHMWLNDSPQKGVCSTIEFAQGILEAGGGSRLSWGVRGGTGVVCGRRWHLSSSSSSGNEWSEFRLWEGRFGRTFSTEWANNSQGTAQSHEQAQAVLRG